MINIKKILLSFMAFMLLTTNFTLSTEQINAKDTNLGISENQELEDSEQSSSKEEKYKNGSEIALKENHTVVAPEGLKNEIKEKTMQDTVEKPKTDVSEKENLGNEPPKKETEKTEAPKIVSKNEDGSYTDINTNEKISANRVQIQMINPLEILDVEIWVKSETDGTYSQKKVSELTDFEKEKYADEIEHASKPTNFGLRSSVILSIGDYTGYSANVTASDGVHTDWSANYQILLIDGEPGFCIQPGIIFVPGSNFTPSGFEQHELSIIAYEGWLISDRSMEAYLATQFMLWEYLGATINSTSFTSYSTYKAEIQDKIKHHYDVPSIKDGNYELSIGETLTLQDTNKVLNKFHLVSTDGLDVEINGNSLEITGTINAKDNARIVLDKFDEQYIGASIVYRKPGSQEAAKLMLWDPLTISINVKVNKFGSLLISKQDEDGSKVANTSFLVSRNADMSSPLGTYTTGSDGTVKVDHILPGTIYVKETSVPDHLVLDSTIYPVTINPNATTTHSLTNNYKKGRISLIKNDSENNVQVGGAVYGVYNSSGTEVQRLTTSSSAAVLSVYLRFGDYTVKEISSPVEYNLNATVYNVQIRNNDEVISVNAKDAPVKGKVEIQKKDIDTGQNVLKTNAQFDIFKTDGTFIETVTTNATGTATSSWLRYGDYFFTEKLAPELYTKNADRTYFNIRSNGVTVQQSIANKRTTGSITLNKVDGVTGTAQGDATLEGAVYGLYAYNTITSPDDNHVIYAKDKLISKLTIANGTASINNLYLGNYYVKEINPSPGYTLDTNTYVITLNYADQNTVNIHKDQTVKERVIAQAFELIKVSSNGDNVEVPLVEGAEFTIKLQSDIVKYGSWDLAPIAKNAQGNPATILVTDKKGYALSQELPYGTYVVRETKVPQNLKPCKDFIVVVNKDNRTPQTWRVMNDTPFEAMLKVVKYDSETGESISLSNATFKIKNVTTGEYLKQWIWYPIPHEIDEFTTSSDGSFYTPALMMYGKYQLEEIKTPDGYLILENPVQFEIGDVVQVEPGPDGKTPVIKVEVPNDPIKGQISVKKEAEVFKGYDFRQTEHGLLYEPLFEKGLLAGVNYQITAAEDILTNDKTLWYSKGNIVDDFVTTADAEYLSALLPLGEYNLQEVATADGYVLDDTIYNISITAEDNITKVILHAEEKWNDKERGSISFEKALEESAYIDVEDAYKYITFGLFTEEPILVKNEEVVPADGLLSVIGLNDNLQGTFGLDFEGKYYIKELTTNDHYILDDTKHSFEYVYSNETLTEIKLDKTIENKLKRGSIELYKADNENKLALAGAEFILSNTEDFKRILQTGTTDETGTIKFDDLEMNTYFIKESKRPAGFELDPTIHKVEINEDGQIITLDLVNTRIRGSFDIVKTSNEPYPFVANVEDISSYLESLKDPNSTTNEGQKFYLEGVEFVVANDKEFKEIIQTGTTDEHGKLSFKGLTEGTYYWKESKCLEGFVLDTTVHEIVISKHDQHDTYELENTVRRSWIEVYKEDAFTKRKLPNAEFTLYIDPECTIELTKSNSDKNGIAKFEGLLNGTYYFKETNAPEGFILSDEIVKVIIDTDTPPKAYKIVYYNTMLPSSSAPSTGIEGNEMNLLLGVFVISSTIIVFANKKKKGTNKDGK